MIKRITLPVREVENRKIIKFAHFTVLYSNYSVLALSISNNSNKDYYYIKNKREETIYKKLQ